MRWANWFLGQSSPSPRFARRKTRLLIHPLEDRTVPHVTGAEHVEPPATPAPTVAVVNETPPAPADGTVIHLDDPAIDSSGGTAVPAEGKVPDAAPTDPAPTPRDGQVPMLSMHTADSLTPAPKPPLPQIGDRVWLDQNANGFADVGEPGIGFVTLQLYRGDTLVGTTTTDALGRYAFNQWNVHNGTADPSDNGLKAGTAYQIRVAPGQAPLAGLRPTFANMGSGNIDEQRDSDAVAGSSAATLDFTMGPDEIYTHYDVGYLPAASVGNLVWNDANNNGKKDRSETGIGGVTVRLLDTAGTEVATTSTGLDGSYQFNGLLPGTYVVEVAASNFAAGGALVGATSSTGRVGKAGGPVEGEGTPDPDTNPTDGDDNGTAVNNAVQCRPVTLAAAASNPAVDFGFFHSTALNGRVFVDQNGNGQVNPEDTTGVAKVRIRVAGPAGVFSTTTDDNGNYSFGNLPAGTYAVTESQPVGYRSSTPNMVVKQLAGGPATTVNFGEARVVDLKVTVGTSREMLGTGGTLVVTYHVKNQGTLDATGVMLTAPIPVGYEVVQSDGVNASMYDANTQRATIGTLAAGADVKIQLKVRAGRPGAVRFKATVQGEEFEDNLRNNTSAAVVTAFGAATPSTKLQFAHGF